MRVSYPLTIIAAVVAIGIGLVGTAHGQMESIQASVAPSWPAFILGILPTILPFVLVVTVVAWFLERRLRRSRTAA